MTFKEQFPGLSKELYVDTPGDILLDLQKVEIQKHCLDKQKVKEAIEEIKNHAFLNTCHDWHVELKKKLGLD